VTDQELRLRYLDEVRTVATVICRLLRDYDDDFRFSVLQVVSGLYCRDCGRSKKVGEICDHKPAPLVQPAAAPSAAEEVPHDR
jgi:hypothetical protein